MKTTKKQHLFRLFSLIFLSSFLVSCAQYGMISENDVYMQKPTALSVGEDETDITSYNAYKARQRGEYQDEYLIDQMYSRSFIGAALYGVRPMFGSPFISSYSIMWGYRSPILGYQNSFYYNSYNYWNSHWAYGYGNSFGYNPHGYCPNGLYGYGFNNCYGNGFGNGNLINGQNNISNNNSSSSQNYFTDGPRMSLSSNSSRSSSYPNSLKSQGVLVGSNVSINNETLGTSRRGVQKKQVVSGSHMPFTNNTNNSNSSYIRTVPNSQENNRSRNGVTRTNTIYPSNSARRNGLARSPRSSVSTSSRTGYNSSQVRRSSTTSYSSSRGGSFNTSRTTSSSSSRSSSGGSSSGSSSSSSSSRRR